MADTIYLGDYDNTIRFALAIDGDYYNTSAITQIDAHLSGIVVTSTNQSTDLIRWNQTGYSAGELRAKFGAAPIHPGLNQCFFVIYDPIYTNGLVFDPIDIPVVQLQSE